MRITPYLFSSLLMFFLLGSIFSKSYASELPSKKLDAIEIALKDLLTSSEQHDFSAIRQTKNRVESLISINPKRLNTVLSELQNSQYNSRYQNELISIITDHPTPLVSQMAIKMIRNKNSNKAKIGLELLSSFEKLPEAATPLIIGIICKPASDVDLTSGAIAAFRNLNLTESLREQSLSCFQQLSKSEDQSIQSESLFSIAKLAKDYDDLAPIISKLDSPIFDIRMSAAMALEKSSINDNRLRRDVLDRLANFDETSDIRRVLQSILSRF